MLTSMDKKLRIALVTNNWQPYSGGVVSSLRMQIAALQTMGHEVMLITLYFLGNEHKDPAFVKRIRCPLRFMYKKNHMAVPWRAYKQVFELLNDFKPHIIHTHHPFLLGVSALKAARILKVPIVFTHHSVYTAFAYYIPLPTCITKPIIARLVKNFYSKVDGIIVPSSMIATHLKTQGIRTPITIISSAVQPVFLSLSETVADEPYGEVFDLLFISRFAKEKNISFLLDVFAQLPKHHFRFTLAGYGHAYDGLKKYAYTELKLDPEYVHFVYKPSLQDLKKLYTKADLFVFGALYETQAIVLAEAMASGIPVVALDGPGQRDIIKNGVNGFIVYSQSNMCEVIQKIAADRDLHRTLSENALKTAQDYTFEHMGQKLINFYTEILAKSLY